MSSQDRKYFRFRFFRVLALQVLFMAPVKTFTAEESCLYVKTAWKESQTDEEDAFTDELNKYLIQLFASVDWEQLHDLQEKIEIVKSVKGGLFPTSVYLICLSYRLYKEAVILAKNYKQHSESFKELQRQIKPVLQAIKTELNSKPESIEFATMYENTEKLLEILNQFCTELEQLAKDVQNDIIKSRIDKAWAAGSGFTALAVCVASAVFFADPSEAILVCVPALGGVGYCLLTFCSLHEAYNKLDQVRENTNKLRLVLVEHQTQLHVAHALMTESTVQMDIDIRSEGCDDPGRTPNTCGFAYIRVNGKDFSPHCKGYNIVVVDGRVGKVLDGRAFDTHWSSSSGDRLREHLNSLNGNKIVLVAIQGEGSNHTTSALDSLKRLGATDPVMLDYRGSFALVGYAGVTKPPWIAQKMAKRGLGPSEISLKIPLALEEQNSSRSLLGSARVLGMGGGWGKKELIP